MKREHMQNRLDALRAVMEERGIGGVFLYGRENSRYFSAFSGTTSLILITERDALIFLDSRYTEQGKAQCLLYEVIEPEGSAFEAVCERVRRESIKSLAFEDADLPYALYHKLGSLLPGVELKAFSEELEFRRRIKDEEELEMIREAVRIADEAFAETWPQIHAGMSELEAAALLEYNMKKRGASKPSFDTICASGLRSAMPHGVASEKIIEDGDIVTMDFGALYQGYCSDITRTFFVGHTSEKLVDIYNTVLRAQLKAEENLKAGMTGQEGDSLARDVIEAAGYGQYFGHGLGHSLGLAIHESPRLSQMWKEPLEEGVLITVEPGIYIPGIGGVRIEDTCIIRKDELEILTAATKELLVTGRRS